VCVAAAPRERSDQPFAPRSPRSGARLSEEPEESEPSKAKGSNMSIKLTDAQTMMLSLAAQREDRCLTPHPSLRAPRARKAGEKLIAAGFVKELKAKATAPIWRRDSETGAAYALKLTALGLKEIVVAESPRDVDEIRNDGKPPLAVLGNDAADVAAIESSPSPTLARGVKGEPRPTTKIAGVIGLMVRPNGATLAELIANTGWLAHTTRAALTGLRKRGYVVTLDRSDRQRGSVYRAEPMGPVDPGSAMERPSEAA
jgi:hypothetical protein